MANFKSVVLPSTVPFILTGLRLAVGRTLIGVMVGELYAATAGIGFMITVAGATFQTDKVFVGVLIFDHRHALDRRHRPHRASI